MARFVLNGTEVSADVPGDMPLLWVLRDVLGFTGTKYGCGMALCGACTVHIDGAAARSCVVPVSGVEGRQITTIEGMGTLENLHPVQQAWIEEQVPQCGYCQPGMIMAVAAFLESNPQPDDAAINQSITNICRCGTYPRIRRAIHRAAQLRRDQSDITA
ncbi:MAG: (2Fe-2S)-binding protein [Gammaproteobacteria bacterium]|nr:(2Fe-2S)-binding protein [Gammaproteobacteria bacterium]